MAFIGDRHHFDELSNLLNLLFMAVPQELYLKLIAHRIAYLDPYF